MNQNTEQIGDKKTYEPPKLVTISLRPEEAVLGHCKISGSGGIGIPGCSIIGLCSSQGS